MKKPKPSVEEQHKTAEEVIGVEIEWESDTRGYYPCPLAAGHTSKTGPKHSRVDLDGVPTFFCWHSSCRDFTSDASGELRSKLDFRSPEEKEGDRIKAAAKQQLKYDAMVLRNRIEWVYNRYAWPQILDNPLSPEKSWHSFLGLWIQNPHDILWIGECWDTGAERGAAHFKPVGEWSCYPPNLYTNRFTSSSTYRPGTFDRTARNVQTTPYLVVEFDSLSPDKTENKLRSAAIFRFLSVAFSLRMVVDSGNKSLHGWFDNKEMTEEVRFFLRQLGADISPMRPSQPVRVPGGRRDNGNVQSVLWITQ